MTWPVTPDPGIHENPHAQGPAALNGLSMLRNFILGVPLQILEAVVAAITGLLDEIPIIGPLLAGPLNGIQNIFTNMISGLLGIPNPSALNTKPSSFSATSLLSGLDNIPILGPLISTLTAGFGGSGSGLSDLASVMESFVATIPIIGPFLSQLIGAITGTAPSTSTPTSTMFGNLGSWFTDLLGIFGSPTGLGTGAPVLSGLDSIPILGPLIGAITGGLGGSGSSSSALSSALTKIPLIGPLISALTGGTGSGTTTSDLASTILALPEKILNGIAAAFGVNTSGGNLFTTLEGDVTTFLSAIPGLNIFGSIRPQVAPVVAASHVGTVNPELLWDPGFDTSGTVSAHAPQITWDGTVGRTALGSLKIEADGNYVYSDVSNPIPVSPGDELTFTIWTIWSGLAYTGTGPIRLEVLQYKEQGVPAPVRVASTPVQGIETPATSESTWQELTGVFVVPADGSVDTVYCRPLVDVTATAGSVWFDDASVQKTGLIAHTNVASSSGLGNIGDDITTTVNTVVSAVTGGSSLGVGGIFEDLFSGVSSLFSLGQTTAVTTNNNAATLAIQNNKPLHNSLNQTAAVSVAIDSLGSGSVPSSFSLTSANAVMAFMSIPQAALNDAIGWHGSGTSGLTGFYVGVYKYDGTANINFVFESANIVTSVANSWDWNAYALPTPIQVQPGEIYGIYFRVTGSGTYTIAGVSQPWMKPYGTFPNQRGATISAVPVPSTIDTGAVAYSTSTPFVEFAVNISVLPATTNAPVTTAFPSSGTFDIPTWAVYLDVIGIGEGSGGAGGSTWGIGGYGGAAGSWAAVTLERGVDIPWTTTTLTVTVPGGGVPGSGGEVGRGPAATSPTTVTGAGWAGLSAAGGAGAVDPYGLGDGSGNYTYRGTLYPGGSIGGGTPGGGGVGGAGGYPYLPGGGGGYGGAGKAWIVARQT